MESINKILVVMDPNREDQPALEKALYLSKVYDASVELLLVVYNRGLLTNLFFNSDELEAAKQGYINSQRRWVESFLSDTDDASIKRTVNVVWHKPLYEAVIEQATAIEADLVIKSTHHHPTINKVLFTPNDWQLMKSCPVPLILAKSRNKQEYKNIMCGIDPSHDHQKPETLDAQIIKTGQTLAAKLGGQNRVCHCYSPIEYQLWSDIGMGMGVGMGPSDFTMGENNYTDYVNELKQGLQDQFDAVVNPFNFEKAQLHLVEGYPEQLLPDLVDEFNIDLLVLGTVYHSGLVGSTAEKILDTVNCDILSVNVPKSE
ncbi:hypothetical protein FLL45_05650 [Aliikangiella marina]|uniref:UspA domain-containing protein n=1 Tax=Aliikangiella marina TaxID=1712262 RepID=A0A545TJN8_9GAMM|nr:universal stress protein [Aliikangiella marina]TQV77428.1 hypothetical protein FLL45_05650 [Aliikangiella marina]